MIFEKLLIFDDPTPGTGPWNMGMDEALGEMTPTPILRVYQWSEPTVSMGYFEKIEAVRKLRPDAALVRRWTGGGMVEHGKDWTYSLVVPGVEPLAKRLRGESYCEIHRALQRMLAGKESRHIEMATGEVHAGEGCFERPVAGDLLWQKRKIAGAAQRRTRRFLLHQGSVQNFTDEKWQATDLAQELSGEWETFFPPQEILQWATELAERRYGQAEWLEKF